MKSNLGLTMEQSFTLQNIKRQVENASPEELRQMVVELSSQIMMMRNFFSASMKEEWDREATNGKES